MVGIFNSIGAGVPPNAGSFRRIEVELRENCAVGIPRHPASCSTATTNLADRVANAVQRGLAELGEGLGLAEVGGVIPAAAGVVSGRDPRQGGTPFVNQIFMVITGGAGTPWTDGWLTIFHAGGAGMLRRDSVEVAEVRHPILVGTQRLQPDSEGAGRFRGAPGAYVEYGPVGLRNQGRLRRRRGGKPGPRRSWWTCRLSLAAFQTRPTTARFTSYRRSV